MTYYDLYTTQILSQLTNKPAGILTTKLIGHFYSFKKLLDIEGFWKINYVCNSMLDVNLKGNIE